MTIQGETGVFFNTGKFEDACIFRKAQVFDK